MSDGWLVASPCCSRACASSSFQRRFTSSLFLALCLCSGFGTLPARASRSANGTSSAAASGPIVFGTSCGLVEEAAAARRVDEHLRVRHAGLDDRPDRREHVRLRAELGPRAEAERLRAELGDRVARVDALRAALVAEVAARAVPDAVRAVQILQARAPRRRRPRAGRRRSAAPWRAPPARGSRGRTPSSCTRRRSSRT